MPALPIRPFGSTLSREDEEEDKVAIILARREERRRVFEGMSIAGIELHHLLLQMRSSNDNNGGGGEPLFKSKVKPGYDEIHAAAALQLMRGKAPEWVEFLEAFSVKSSAVEEKTTAADDGCSKSEDSHRLRSSSSRQALIDSYLRWGEEVGEGVNVSDRLLLRHLLQHSVFVSLQKARQKGDVLADTPFLKEGEWRLEQRKLASGYLRHCFRQRSEARKEEEDAGAAAAAVCGSSSSKTWLEKVSNNLRVLLQGETYFVTEVLEKFDGCRLSSSVINSKGSSATLGGIIKRTEVFPSCSELHRAAWTLFNRLNFTKSSDSVLHLLLWEAQIFDDGIDCFGGTSSTTTTSGGGGDTTFSLTQFRENWMAFLELLVELLNDSIPRPPGGSEKGGAGHQQLPRLLSLNPDQCLIWKIQELCMTLHNTPNEHFTAEWCHSVRGTNGVLSPERSQTRKELLEKIITHLPHVPLIIRQVEPVKVPLVQKGVQQKNTGFTMKRDLQGQLNNNVVATVEKLISLARNEIPIFVHEWVRWTEMPAAEKEQMILQGNLTSARQTIQDLRLQDIVEVKAWKKPPEVMIAVFKALYCVLEYQNSTSSSGPAPLSKVDWQTIKREIFASNHGTNSVIARTSSIADELLQDGKAAKWKFTMFSPTASASTSAQQPIFEDSAAHAFLQMEEAVRNYGKPLKYISRFGDVLWRWLVAVVEFADACGLMPADWKNEAKTHLTAAPVAKFLPS